MMVRQELTHVWKSIEPAVPDCIEQVAPNVFEARWWKPVPTNDIQILCHANNVEVIGEPFEPQHLPLGIAVRFTVYA
jgi:hypothetical protein